MKPALHLALVVALGSAATGCGPFTNGQLGQLYFDTRGPLAVGDTFPVDAFVPPGVQCPPVSPMDTMTPSRPDLLSVSNVARAVDLFRCGLHGDVQALAPGHAQLVVLIGRFTPGGGIEDTIELWVEEPRRLIVNTGRTMGPIDPDVVHISSDAVAALQVEVRSASEATLEYTSVPSVAVDPAGVADVATMDGDVLVTPLAPGTTTLTASLFGLSDSVTIVVDPPSSP